VPYTLKAINTGKLVKKNKKEYEKIDITAAVSVAAYRKPALANVTHSQVASSKIRLREPRDPPETYFSQRSNAD